MTAPLVIRQRDWSLRRLAYGIAIGALLAVLVYCFAAFVATGARAVTYPFELDYGEGIVWQQMRWLFTEHAYGPIDTFPAIVFHYTPLYHALTWLVAAAIGTDELATGRAISLVATALAAVASGLIVAALLQQRAGHLARLACGLIAALLLFTFMPVTVWAPLMRVDMLALALGLIGLWAAIRSIDSPRLIYAAAACFVAAVYTKQTAIAAPAAAFSVLLALRPGLALRGLAACVVLGLALLLTLEWLTDGGFHRHVFLYNVNRLEFDRLNVAFYAIAAHPIYVGVALMALGRGLAELASRYRGSPDARTRLARNSADAGMLMIAAYFAVSTAMLPLIVKTGSNVNYFLEWFCAVGILCGLAPVDAVEAVRGRRSRRALFAGLLAGALAVQAAALPKPTADFAEQGRDQRALARLSSEIAAAEKPVISDDMVLLIRSGQDVLWESAIFAELASMGMWDERPFVQRIRRGEFAFFVTYGQRGDDRFDERYTPAVAAAIDAAYPQKSRIGSFIVHRPTSPDPASER